MNKAMAVPTLLDKGPGNQANHNVELSIEQRRVHNMLRRELGVLWDYLQDERVQEIFVNPNGAVLVDRAGESRHRAGFMEASRVACILSTVAATLHEVINHRKPHIDGTLVLDGSRISGEIPPLVSAPSLRIRKHAKHVKPLRYSVDTGVMSEHQYDYVHQAIRAEKNIVVVGSTASGKTFLLNSILADIATLVPDDRVLSIEDTPELTIHSNDALAWVTTPEVDMQMMLRRALRATPKRIVVGEVRGGEAYQLLKMWDTGHNGGLCTIHSNQGPLDGLRRLERMCGESVEARGMGRDSIRELIAGVVHVVINITIKLGRRRVPSLVEVNGLDSQTGQYHYTSMSQ